MSDNEQREWHARVDPRLRHLVEGGAEGNDTLRVFIRTNAPHDRLEQLGARIGQAAGDIVTAELSVADVPAVACEPGVEYIELSRPLWPDDEPPG
jgi:hypothetical protein